MLFSFHFRTSDESVYLSSSEGGVAWKPENSNLPVLTRTPPGILRDPFVLRDNLGAFRLLATCDWRGKKAITAQSWDLVHWKDVREISLMEGVTRCRNVWAPKAFWDSEEMKFRVIWSSTISWNLFSRPNQHRIWSCLTEDFFTFSKAELWFDPGFNCIDAHVVENDNCLFMVFKDERGTWGRGPDFRTLRTAFREAGSSSFLVSDPILDCKAEGPFLCRNHTGWLLYYDRYMDGTMAVIESVDFVHWTKSDMTGPFLARHGSLIEM